MAQRSLQEEMEPFARLGLTERTLRALKEMGFERPTPIQERAIPVVLDGKDIIGQARTGTGKTAAFGLPIIERFDTSSRALQGLVLCPTRELALQVATETERMGKYSGLSVLPVYGGADMEKQVREFRKGVHLVAGTPGRVMDHMRRGNMHVGGIDFLVLDEADRMLDMGFIEDIEWILTHAPPKGKRQMMLFSATMPSEVLDIAQRFMMSPVNVSVSTDELTVPEVKQVYYSVGRKNKLWALARVIDYEKPTRMLVFCATKRMVDILTERLNKVGYDSDAIHGDLSQSRREKMIERFKSGELHILVATDVAARGLDITDVTHVVNYDLPDEPEVYVHRIGRTGRAGKSGKAITFISKGDKRPLELVERIAGTRIDLSNVPGEEELEGDEEGTAKRPRDKVRKVVDWEHIADRYGNVHIRMDVGRKDGVTMVALHRFVQQEARVPDYAVGNIRVNEDHCLFDLPLDVAPGFLERAGSMKWKERSVDVDVIPQDGS